MTNFVPLGFYDPFEVIASLPTRMGDFATKEGGQRIMPVKRIIAAKKWPEMANLISTIRRELEGSLGPQEIGLLHLEMLDPGSALPWDVVDGSAGPPWTRLHLALRTNPACALFSGTQAFSPQLGYLVAVASNLPYSAINLGATSRVHLIADVRKRADA